MHKKVVFLCQIDEAYLKVAKCALNKNKKEVVGLFAEPIAVDIDDKDLADKLSQVFNKLGYNNNPIIISLPRHQATSRYLKIPSANPQEIEKITALQAPRYLPYPADELITAFEIVSTEKDGSSYVNQIIVQKKIIERYINLFKNFNRLTLNIILSSYSICNLYNYISQPESTPIMLIDIDGHQMQSIITYNKKLIFSRSFELLKSQPDWQDTFINEINKTQDACKKETGKELPARIIFIGEGKNSEIFMEILKKQPGLPPVELFSYIEKINLSKGLGDYILNSDISFASIIGLGLKDTDKSLSLLTRNLKKEIKGSVKFKERSRIVLFIAAIAFMLGLGIIKDLDNRAKYLIRLKTELNKIAKDAKGLEDMDKRFKMLAGSRKKDKPALFAILYELNQIMPEQVSLSTLTYEEGQQVILRAEAPELNYVFMFVSGLEKSRVFKDFSVKIRYATKRQTQTAEFVDFEVVCLKSK